MGLTFHVSGYKTPLMMACFHRQRHPRVARGPHAVHCGLNCQLRGAHSPPRGAVCAAAAEAEVFPSQPVSPVAVAAGVAVGGWPWQRGAGGLAGLCWSVCAQGKGRALCVLNFQVYQVVCFCFTSIVILTGSLQIRKLRLRELK